MHFAREPRENERAALRSDGCESPFLFPLHYRPTFRDQPVHARFLSLFLFLSVSRSCMTGGHERATELALVRIAHFTTRFCTARETEEERERNREGGEQGIGGHY